MLRRRAVLHTGGFQGNVQGKAGGAEPPLVQGRAANLEGADLGSPPFGYGGRCGQDTPRAGWFGGCPRHRACLCPPSNGSCSSPMGCSIPGSDRQTAPRVPKGTETKRFEVQEGEFTARLSQHLAQLPPSNSLGTGAREGSGRAGLGV